MWVFNVYRVFALFSKQFEQFRLATATKSRTQSHDNGEEDGACATRFSASALHRFTFTLVSSPANYTTPHHTTHTEQHTRFESASQSRAPTHTSAAAKSSFETEPSCAGTIRVGARIGPQWNRLCTENEIWTTHNINPEIRLFKLRSGFRRSESIVKTNLKNSIQILIYYYSSVSV